MDRDRVTGDGRARSPDELWAGLVAEIAAMPDVMANLLREHRPDEHGCCLGNGCGTAGRGVPTMRWPCSLHTLATAAQRVSAGEERTGKRTAGAEAAPSDERTGPTTRRVYTAADWILRGR